MKKSLVFFLGFVFVASFIPFASAMTEINVKTYSDHIVWVVVAAPTVDYEVLETFSGTTDANGMISFDYSERGSKVKIYVTVKNSQNTEIAFEKLGEFPTGEPMYLQILPGAVSKDYREFEKPAEEAANEEEIPVEEVQEGETIEETLGNSTGITGNVVNIENSSGFSSWLFYIVLGFVVVGLIGLVIAKRKIDNGVGIGGRMSLPKMPVPSRKVSLRSKIEEDEAMILDAEEKIKQAKAEIASLRNRDKIRIAEEQLKKDQEELRKLRDETSPN